MSAGDKTPSFGVPRLEHIPGPEPSLGGAGDAIDPVSVSDLNVLDAYFHELGMLAANDPSPMTPEEEAIVNEIYQAGLELMKRSPAEVRAERHRRKPT